MWKCPHCWYWPNQEYEILALHLYNMKFFSLCHVLGINLLWFLHAFNRADHSTFSLDATFVLDFPRPILVLSILPLCPYSIFTCPFLVNSIEVTMIIDLPISLCSHEYAPLNFKFVTLSFRFVTLSYVFLSFLVYVAILKNICCSFISAAYILLSLSQFHVKGMEWLWFL